MLLFLTLLVADPADGKCNDLTTFEPLVLEEGAPPGWPASARLIVWHNDGTGMAESGRLELDDGVVAWWF